MIHLNAFKIEYLIGPCVVLGLIFNHEFRFPEVMRLFSAFFGPITSLDLLLWEVAELSTFQTRYSGMLGCHYRGVVLIPTDYLHIICRWYVYDVVGITVVVTGRVKTRLYPDPFHAYSTQRVVHPTREFKFLRRHAGRCKERNWNWLCGQVSMQSSRWYIMKHPFLPSVPWEDFLRC